MTSGRTRTKAERRAAGQVRLEISLDAQHAEWLREFCEARSVSKTEGVRLLIAQDRSNWLELLTKRIKR